MVFERKSTGPLIIFNLSLKYVAGGILQIGFDGWGDDFDQFVEWRSPDIYPAGWCELVRHQLQAPKDSVAEKSSKRYEYLQLICTINIY